MAAPRGSAVLLGQQQAEKDSRKAKPARLTRSRVVQNCDACRTGRNKCDRLETCSECVRTSPACSNHTRADTHALAQNRLEIARLRAQVAILLRLARISAEDLPLLLHRAAQDEPVVLPVPRAQPWVKREEGGHPLLSLCLAAEASDASSETSELALRTGGSEAGADVNEERELSPGTEDSLGTLAPPMDGPSVVIDEKRRASLAPGALERIYLPLRRMSSADGDKAAAGQRRRSVV
ncbi:hypothetical protein JCM10450v2_002623 [Rhodotorula kratochvilovae]